MKCPKCNSGKLCKKPLQQGHLVLDECDTCNGLWFDDGEMSQFLGIKSAGAFNIPKISLKNARHPCPRCREGMYEFCYPGTAVFIDMCANCRGIFLDYKEWKEIKSARSEFNHIVCPQCKTKQIKAESCTSCGSVFSRIHESKRSKGEFNMERSKRNKAISGCVSYADDIPGLKGALLRFIDRAISDLKKF